MRDEEIATGTKRGGEPEAKAYRTIPEDVLREFYTDQIELSSLKTVAARAGIGRTTLHSFMNGSSPHPRTRRLLGLYYLSLQGTARHDEALRVLSGGDEELQHALAEAIAEHHRKTESRFPGERTQPGSKFREGERQARAGL